MKNHSLCNRIENSPANFPNAKASDFNEICRATALQLTTVASLQISILLSLYMTLRTLRIFEVSSPVL